MTEATAKVPLKAPRINAMTVDVEEYFQVAAFENHVPSDRWAHIPSRVEASIDRILALFELAGVQATFFTVGWVAERHPTMIRRIVDAGHELASHGMNHVRVFRQDRPTFAADIRQSKQVLEDIGGQRIKGYRAATFSIDQRNLWALDELADAGFEYSSSIYPGTHPAYGMPEAQRFAFRVADGRMLEVPITTAEVAGRRMPCAGGGFFRLYPYALTRQFLRGVNRGDGESAVFYFHPWEVDADQPRVPGVSFKTRIRHYLNIHRVESRLEKLLGDFGWGRMDQIFLEHKAPAESGR
ncbi:MAG: DUF3473 domain-containing protein [Salinisphaera sp.]|jgi:polysaccharide deacetylase family protein (PEP-CTERM system associated)|nr:DUF3473 domain-containing protein [Salinisphaera sp.]